MKIKFSSLEIKSDLLPHDKEDIEQYKEIASFIYDAIIETPSVDVVIDDKLLHLYLFLTSKLLDGIVDNIYAYLSEIKGPKYLSGDVSMTLSEILTYATINQIYDVKPLNIIPFRSVKYLGTIVDAMIDLSKEKKLSQMLNAKSNFLFINIRSSMSTRPYYIIDKLSKSLQNLEIIRYPDNYGLISILVKNETFNESFIFVKP